MRKPIVTLAATIPFLVSCYRGPYSPTYTNQAAGERYTIPQVLQSFKDLPTSELSDREKGKKRLYLEANNLTLSVDYSPEGDRLFIQGLRTNSSGKPREPNDISLRKRFEDKGEKVYLLARSCGSAFGDDDCDYYGAAFEQPVSGTGIGAETKEKFNTILQDVGKALTQVR